MELKVAMTKLGDTIVQFVQAAIILAFAWGLLILAGWVQQVMDMTVVKGH